MKRMTEERFNHLASGWDGTQGPIGELLAECRRARENETEGFRLAAARAEERDAARAENAQLRAALSQTVSCVAGTCVMCDEWRALLSSPAGTP